MYVQVYILSYRLLTYRTHQGISFDTNTSFAPYKILVIILGALAIAVGVAVLIWMPDSPVHAKFLTEEEKIAAIERVRDDQGGTENKKLKKEQVLEALTDLRTWLIVLSTLVSTLVSLFSPLSYGADTFLASIPNGGLSNCEL